MEGEKLPTSLTSLYSPEGILNDNQRKHYCSEIIRLLSSQDSTERTITECLAIIYINYDLGGHSTGRSARSVLLEATMKAVREGRIANAKILLSHLIAMYHDIEHVKRNNWYDFPLENFLDTSATERHPLIVAGMLLDIDVLPPIPENFNPYDLISTLN